MLNEKFEAFKKKIKGKNIGVVGIGISNTPLIKMLVENGAYITARDKKDKNQLGDIANELESLNVKLILGENYLEGIYEDIIFKTPGMRIDTPQLIEAQKNGAVITSEMEVFFEICPAKIIAVTGSDGKTTTTTLIYEMLKQSGYKCWLGGNIGNPLLCEIENIDENDKVVLELSSFQLHSMKKSPKIAVVTNLSPNHLDMHKSMEEYIDAKTNIFKFQNSTDTLILNFDNEITKNLASCAISNVTFFSRVNNCDKGVYLKNNYIFYDDNQILNIDDIKLPGVHNIENYMAAIAAVSGMVSADVIVNVAKTFGGVPHRIEFVRELNEVKYYNDSIASSPTRARAGLYSFNQKLIMIAGGYDKKIPFDDFGNDIVDKVKVLILMGKTAAKIKNAVLSAKNYIDKPEIIEATDLEDAVNKAYKVAQKDDIVMLSPACASFDMFKNFEERGNLYKQYVMELI